ncbi:collagen alpha-2(VIII) chain-like isoform X1 [Dreissena polymorpha]|uniref:collagen alpha-2(VIII) chain-like isoform X1 n=1 Tax=Dreissena polymorpha TaxID=45954 RepID=UPI002263B163|nr:collagen alpha-2(VIII) chain-like isoform X1 [Dreissena polymorpha]
MFLTVFPALLVACMSASVRGFVVPGGLVTGSGSAVVFHAHGPSNTSPASGKIIEYTVVEVNEGQGYNASNGVFMAPAGGMYMFSTQTCIWSNTFVLIAIIKEGVVVQPSALYDTSPGYAPCSSSQAFVRLSAGQRVWVESRRTNNGNMLFEDEERWTSFSGVLL